MAIATWWYGDARPALSESQGFWVSRSADSDLLSNINGVSEDEVRRRFTARHQAYIGWLDGEPATYGWLATRSAQIGELRLRLTLPPENAYLWDFGTLEPVRGLGLYPRLLDAIRERVTPRFTRLWIIHAPENEPSGLGIERAGFTSVGELSFDRRSRVRLAPTGRPERSIAAARLLGLETTDEVLSACWTCETSTPCGCRDPRHASCSCHMAPRRAQVHHVLKPQLASSTPLR